MDNSDGLWMYLMLLMVHLKMYKIVNFISCAFCHSFLKLSSKNRVKIQQQHCTVLIQPMYFHVAAFSLALASEKENWGKAERKAVVEGAEEFPFTRGMPWYLVPTKFNTLSYFHSVSSVSYSHSYFTKGEIEFYKFQVIHLRSHNSCQSRDLITSEPGCPVSRCLGGGWLSRGTSCIAPAQRWSITCMVGRNRLGWEPSRQKNNVTKHRKEGPGSTKAGSIKKRTLSLKFYDSPCFLSRVD